MRGGRGCPSEALGFLCESPRAAGSSSWPQPCDPQGVCTLGSNTSSLLGKCSVSHPHPPQPWLSSPGIILTWLLVGTACARPVLSRFSDVQLCVIPMDGSPPGSSVHDILQASILEWVAILSSRGSSRPRDRTCTSQVSCISEWVLYCQCHLWLPPYSLDCSIFLILLRVTTMLNVQFCGRFKNKTCKHVI